MAGLAALLAALNLHHPPERARVCVSTNRTPTKLDEIARPREPGRIGRPGPGARQGVRHRLPDPESHSVTYRRQSETSSRSKSSFFDSASSSLACSGYFRARAARTTRLIVGAMVADFARATSNGCFPSARAAQSRA